MNKENLKLWIEDLRTTEAPQTTEVLHDTFGFCCMGRLCVVAIAAGVNVDAAPTGGPEGIVTYDCSDAFPPDSVKGWLDPEGDLDCGERTQYDVFADWNDSERLTFHEIADRLEAEYLS